VSGKRKSGFCTWYLDGIHSPPNKPVITGWLCMAVTRITSFYLPENRSSAYPNEVVYLDLCPSEV